MFKIGDFSKLSQVSVKTLRYYDEMDLLRPAEVDRWTGYRYYSAAQLPRLNRILALKDLGFSLEEIKRLLDEDLPPAQIRGMLRLKQAEIRRHVAEGQERMARVEARLRQLEREDKEGSAMSAYEVVLKKVEPQHVASLRAVIPAYDQVGPLWGELYAVLGGLRIIPAGPPLAIYYDNEYKEQDVDTEICQPVAAPFAGQGRVTSRELPGVEQMACVVHPGEFASIGQAYGAIMAWVEANGYRIIGPNREVYLHHTQRGDHASNVTEVQLVVEKIVG